VSFEDPEASIGSLVMRDSSHLLSVVSAIATATLLVHTPVRAAENMPSWEGGETTMPTVELIMTTEGRAAKCSPAEIKLPANTDVRIRITNQ
jgi:hypothetical protein